MIVIKKLLFKRPVNFEENNTNNNETYIKSVVTLLPITKYGVIVIPLIKFQVGVLFI